MSEKKLNVIIVGSQSEVAILISVLTRIEFRLVVHWLV